MKKLALMTTVAVVCLSVPAMADSYYKHDGKRATNERYDDSYRLNVQNEPNMKTQVQTTTRTRTEVRPAGRQEFTLLNGGKIVVNNEAVYLKTAGGSTYPAPSGSYETTSDFTIVSDDGVWLRTEGPMETVYVDIDADNDGAPDQVRTRTY